MKRSAHCTTFDIVDNGPPGQLFQAGESITGNLSGWKLVFLSKPIKVNGSEPVATFADFNAKVFTVDLSELTTNCVRDLVMVAFEVGILVGRNASTV